MTKKKFYVTTPIYYVNDKPHIGHACTTLAADILARYHKLLGEDVLFLTGTDEHGANVEESAKKAGLSPKEFCDQVSQTFQNIWPKLNIQYDYFIRTTNPEHKKIVQEVIQKIYQNGDIYKGKYEGYYCVGCEKFITETEIVDGKCPLHPTRPLQKQSEENYFFRLSKYAPALIKAIENSQDKNHYLINPPSKREEILSKLKTGVNDLSISRANVSWGIPIPWDKTQTFYVWIDALLNYYSALRIIGQEKYWPADLHLIGKEISWFHCAIWEAMLLSAGIRLPKEIFVHSFYLIDGMKMSKSLGNVITPEDLLARFGIDGVRYLIASSFPYDNDNNVGWGKFTEKYNADLANGLGNLVARVTTLAQKYSNSRVPGNIKDPYKKPSIPLIESERQTTKILNVAFCKYQLAEALQAIWKFITNCDEYIDKSKPWNLAKKKSDSLNQVIYNLLESLHQIAWFIFPFMPDTSLKIAKRLGIRSLLKDSPREKDAWIPIKPGTPVKVGAPLFPRLKQ